MLDLLLLNILHKKENFFFTNFDKIIHIIVVINIMLVLKAKLSPKILNCANTLFIILKNIMCVQKIPIECVPIIDKNLLI